jgi:hypothetical protein
LADAARVNQIELEAMRDRALTRLANVSVLILYGAPRIDEPLTEAWERCRTSPVWLSYIEKCGGWDEYGGNRFGSLFRYAEERIGKYFRKNILPDHPGADEIQKLSAILKKAPPWLLWFTYADLEARILGIELPDLSSVDRFMRNETGLSGFPSGPFECLPRPDGVEDKWVALYMRAERQPEPDSMTRRERKRMLMIQKKYKL